MRSLRLLRKRDGTDSVTGRSRQRRRTTGGGYSREGSASEGRFSSGKGSSQGARNDSRQQGGGSSEQSRSGNQENRSSNQENRQSSTGKNQAQRQQTVQNQTNTRQQSATQRTNADQQGANSRQQSRQNYGQNTQQSRQNYGQNAQQNRQNFANNYGSTGSGGAWSRSGSPGNWGGYYAGMPTATGVGLAMGATVQSLPLHSTPIVAQGNPYYYSGGVYYAPQQIVTLSCHLLAER